MDIDFAHEKVADPEYKKFLQEEQITDLSIGEIASGQTIEGLSL